MNMLKVWVQVRTCIWTTCSNQSDYRVFYSYLPVKIVTAQQSLSVFQLCDSADVLKMIIDAGGPLPASHRLPTTQYN